MAKKVVLLIAGLCGSGKTTAARIFRLQGIPVVRMGDATDRFLNSKSKKINETNERRARRELREKFGQDYYARESLPKIKKELAGRKLLALEGLRSEEERLVFSGEFVDCRLLYLESSRKLRIKRLVMRKNRPLKKEQIILRERYERESLGTHRLKKKADYLVKNDGRLESFHEKIRQIIERLKND